SVLLTQTNLATRLPLDQVRAICLDADWEQIAQEGAEAPACHVLPDHLAYIIYTSGSTGQPKGVMNTQRGIVNRLQWMQAAYGLAVPDRVLQKTPFSFDVSVWEFFWPLLNGACLVLARPEGHKDSHYLVEVIVEQDITTLHFVPSMLRVFLEEAAVARCVHLKRVICSGEALPFELQERFFACLGAELHNLYGPTEAAVDVSFWACRRGEQRPVVPIGRPIANLRLYVLDGHLEPTPLGVPGELWIGGVGVARGYLRQAGLTAERFLPDPFSEVLGARMYRTGDWVRYLPDGNLEFLGRQDQQVKLRGFRIELGEIEAALAAWPEVREAVVVAREDLPGDKRLVAYLVPQAGQRLAEPPELRQQLLQCLPDYMVPANFIVLESLP
ncbi:hypothetical protein RHDC3_02217, partial [Rhodocyclaceae bacterium]